MDSLSRNIRFLAKTQFAQLTTKLLLVLSLGGCAGGVTMLPTLSNTTEVKPDEGIVVAKVINASAYPLPFNQLTISPKNLNESKEIKPLRLIAQDSVITDSTVYAAPVKAGSYAMDSIRSFHIRGDYWYERWAPTDATFGTFEVEPNKVTDLGVIIYYPKPQEDRYSNELTRKANEVPAETLDSFFSFYQFDKADVLGWNEEGLDEELQEKYISFAQNPVTYNDAYRGANGDVYFFGKLGVILVRTADGEWQMEGVDTDVDLSTMVQTPQGHLVIAGNEGKTFIKKSGQDAWQDISFEPWVAIDQLYVHNDIYLDALTRTADQVSVFRTNLQDKETIWQQVATYRNDDIWLDAQGEMQQVSIEILEKRLKSRKKTSAKKITSVAFDTPEAPHRLTIKMTARPVEQYFGNTTNYHYSVDLDHWLVTEDKLDSEMNVIANAGHRKVGIEKAGFWSWTGKPSYHVYDESTTSWSEITTNIPKCKKGYKLISDKQCKSIEEPKKSNGWYKKPLTNSFSLQTIPWFKSQNEAVAIASFSDNKRVIIHTADKGKTWKQSDYELPNEYCSTFVGEIKDVLTLSCNGASGDFYQSTDFGKSWELVREHQDF